MIIKLLYFDDATVSSQCLLFGLINKRHVTTQANFVDCNAPLSEVNYYRFTFLSRELLVCACYPTIYIKNVDLSICCVFSAKSINQF